MNNQKLMYIDDKPIQDFPLTAEHVTLENKTSLLSSTLDFRGPNSSPTLVKYHRLSPPPEAGLSKHAPQATGTRTFSQMGLKKGTNVSSELNARRTRAVGSQRTLKITKLSLSSKYRESIHDSVKRWLRTIVVL